MPDVALFEPEIPGNAGSIARLCAATGAPLHLIGRLGFSFRHPEARRAGMDYWAQAQVHRHVSYDDFRSFIAGRSVWMFTTRASRSLWEVELLADDVLLFGPESRGLPAQLLDAAPESCVRIPIRTGARSLNLATSAAVALYEVLRQESARRGTAPFIDTPEGET